MREDIKKDWNAAEAMVREAYLDLELTPEDIFVLEMVPACEESAAIAADLVGIDQERIVFFFNYDRDDVEYVDYWVHGPSGNSLILGTAQGLTDDYGDRFYSVIVNFPKALVLLHEMAHCVVNNPKEGHGENFRAALKDLVAKFTKHFTE